MPVRVEWRAFELRPDPVPTLDPDGAYLHRVWNQSVYPMARERGLTLRLPPVQPRSRKAHEATAFARSAGRADATAEALFGAPSSTAATSASLRSWSPPAARRASMPTRCAAPSTRAASPPRSWPTRRRRSGSA